MAVTASPVSLWIDLIRVEMRLVASPERSASRSTSSATTAKPRPASPAMAAWMEAFRARIEVRSAMSPMSWTISPISWELSPSRLIRFAVSCTWPRMAFMPAMVLATASVPWRALLRACSATVAAWPEVSETC